MSDPTTLPTDSGPLRLTVVVPAFNESETIEACLDEIEAALSGLSGEAEIVVVDDGSSDDTAERAERRTPGAVPLRVVRHAVNQGSGQAIWTGIENARGECVLYAPADGQFYMREIPDYLRAMDWADIVMGVRDSRPDYTLYRWTNSIVFLWAVNRLFGMNFRDVNWVHIWRRDVFRTVKPRFMGVFFLVEILVRARAAGFRVGEIPSGYKPRAGGAAKGSRPEVVLRTIREMLRFWFRFRILKKR